LTSYLKPAVAPALTIGGSTAVAYAISQSVLAVFEFRRTIAAEVYGAVNWIAQLDPSVATAVVGVTMLIAIAVFVRRMA
jgi:hypothetical protein